MSLRQQVVQGHPQGAREATDDVEWWVRDLALLASGRPRDAVMTFERAVAAAPERAINHYGLGRAYAAVGNRDGARAQYAALRDLDPILARQLFEEIAR